MSASELFFDTKDWNSQTFTANGTWTAPDGVALAYIILVGGGQGGQGSRTFDATVTRGQGGNGGQITTFLARITPNIGATISFTRGAGGDGSPSVNGPLSAVLGDSGGDSVAVISSPALTIRAPGGNSANNSGVSGGPVGISGSNSMFAIGGTSSLGNGGGGGASWGAGANGSSSGNGLNATANSGGGGSGALLGSGGNGGSGRMIVYWPNP
jgi:hypothetical protein